MSKSVLVVEDDPDQRRLLERMLTAGGWRVSTAPDGEAGIRVAIATPPDIVVLDVMMPELNGFQTCRRLKSEPATRSVPVVILTSKDQPSDEFWAREVGADAFLHKPADIQTLMALLSRLTEQS